MQERYRTISKGVPAHVRDQSAVNEDGGDIPVVVDGGYRFAAVLGDSHFCQREAVDFAVVVHYAFQRLFVPEANSCSTALVWIELSDVTPREAGARGDAQHADGQH